MNNINFKGYSNIVSADGIPTGNFRISYLAMKLDDEGEKDLTKLKQIRKLQGYPAGIKNEDIITFTHFTNGKIEDIYFNEKPMCWGEQLKIVQEEYIPKFISQDKYKELESAHLKAYTLLASLTKRLSFDKFENEDSDIGRVIQTLHKNLISMKKGNIPLFDYKSAFNITGIGCLKQYKYQPLAEKFNKMIMSTMSNFFRV
jgi:hypothetical protein